MGGELCVRPEEFLSLEQSQLLLVELWRGEQATDGGF